MAAYSAMKLGGCWAVMKAVSLELMKDVEKVAATDAQWDIKTVGLKVC